MSSIVDNVFAEVCLDERIKDGIFKLEEEEHMNALRDYFVKKGITQEAAVTVTNRMVEGRFPERQAYNKDGILVTFPTPQHKAKAIQRGTHFEKNPAPQNSTPPREPQPAKELPPSPPKEKEVPPPKEEPVEKEPVAEPKGGVATQVAQGDQQLAVEPPRGSEKPEPTPPQSPTPPPAPRTPERVAAEKEVAKQIMATDDTALSPVAPPLNEDTAENQIRIMRDTIVSVIDSLPYPKLKEAYDIIVKQFGGQ
jgi:hypothetical protein